MKPTIEETIEYVMTHYDGLMRRLGDIGPLTLERIVDEHQRCDKTNGACPFCILIAEIERIEAVVVELAE